MKLDDLIGVDEAAVKGFDANPLTGRPVSSKSVTRWLTEGRRTRSGIVILESWVVGGKRVTTVAACRKFVAAVKKANASCVAAA